MMNMLGYLLSASSIGIIGGADGPTAVFVTTNMNMDNVNQALNIMGKGRGFTPVRPLFAAPKRTAKI